MAWRSVEVGVTGERNERVISRPLVELTFAGAGMRYVKFVVEASYWEPRYVGNETLNLEPCQTAAFARTGVYHSPVTRSWREE